MARSLTLPLLALYLALPGVAAADICAMTDPNRSAEWGYSSIRFSNQDAGWAPLGWALNVALSEWNSCPGQGLPELKSSGTANMTVPIYWRSGRPSTNPAPCASEEDVCGCAYMLLSGGALSSAEIHLWQDCGGGAETRLIHEIGHILGLDDAYSDSCAGRVMFRSPMTNALHANDCSVADSMWAGDQEGPPEGEEDPGPTPILLDMDGGGFHLSGINPPVYFDLDGDGQMEPLSWTAVETGDAFLARDINGNGQIDDGTELFGSGTRLLDGSLAIDGFQAMAELDTWEAGGNGNGFLDAGDSGFSELLLWTDQDRSGSSAPWELVGLEEAGIVGLDLSYKESRRRDRWGNELRYASKAWTATLGRGPHLKVVDVFLILGGAP